LAKTDWQMNDVVQPADMNDIGQEINAKETPAGAQAKADAAETNANSYTDTIAGLLSNLTTTQKANLVAAINELVAKVGTAQSTADEALPNTSPTVQNNGADPNSFTNKGLYRIFNAPVNIPTGYTPSNNDFTLLVNRINDVNYIRHTLWDMRSNRIFTRSRLNGNWGSWSELITSAGGQTINGSLTISSSSAFIDSPGGGNVHLYLRRGGVNKGLLYNEASNNTTKIRSYSDTSTSDFIDLTMRQSDGTIWWGANQLLPSRFNATTGAYEVLDGGTWKPVGGVKNVQRGSVQLNWGSGEQTQDVTITSVNTSKSSLNLNTIYAIAGDTTRNHYVHAVILNATTIRITYFLVQPANLTVQWELTESY